MKRLLLIDGDTLIFEAASANEYDTQWSEWLWTCHADLNQAIAQLDRSIKEIQENLQTDETIIALSDEARWRPAIMPCYKNHRRKTRKPVVYTPLREYCHEVYDVFQRPTLEGDDVLGILATMNTANMKKVERIIVSIDKDLKTIPGKLVNYKHARESGDWSPIEITVEQADRFHLFQTLTGDTSDGYPGCPGIGPVKAEKLLDASCTWDAVVGAYQKAGLNESVALENAQVARICRASDYDFKNRKVIPWTPGSVQ